MQQHHKTTYNIAVTERGAQVHTHPHEKGNTNDIFNVTFGQIGRYTQGQHLRGYAGSDKLNFTDTANVSATVVGRFEDFDPTRDSISVDGDLLDFNSLPDNVKIVRHNGENNDPGADPQQWLLIETSSGGHIFYALEGARVDITGDGGSNTFTQESHFVRPEYFPDFDSIKAVRYENPFNFIPAGEATRGGIRIEDDHYVGGNKFGDREIADTRTPILGTNRGDLIAGGLNNDNILGGGGSDKIWGGDGSDFIVGGEGSDIIYGNAGNDRLSGSYGRDSVLGDDGNDLLRGHSGKDFLKGGDGNDTVVGGKHNDRVFGNNGDDVVSGGEGNDLLTGNHGNDIIRGDAGADTLHGGVGSDIFYGGDGNDYLHVGTPAGDKSAIDQLYGGGGSDTFIFYGETGRSVIKDFEVGVDSISFSDSGIDGMSDLIITYYSAVGGDYALISYDGDSGDAGVIKIGLAPGCKLGYSDFTF